MQRGLLTLLLAAVSLAAFAGAVATSAARPLVPRNAYLVAGESGRLLVLDRRGKLVRRIPRFAADVQALALSPSRRSAYVSVYVRDRPPRMYEVSLRTGRRTLLANAISPALSPGRAELAYVTVARPVDIEYRTALVIRDLQTGNLRIIAFPPGVPFDTPPGLVINWSPGGRAVALWDGTTTRIVDVSTATTVDSQSAIPGGGYTYSPVFLDRYTLVVLANCCIGRQKLVAVDLRSGIRTPFAQLSSPVENVIRLKPRALLAVTALHRLVRVTPGRSHVIARRIVAATA